MHQNRRRARSLVLVGCGAVLGTLLVALPVQAAGKPQPPLDVRVVNTTAEPVPVAVEGTPTVKLDTSTPLLVRNADEPARQAISRGDVIGIAAGSQFGSATLYTVPAGKRLVIQTESAKSALGSGATDLVAIFSTGTTAFVPQTHYGTFVGQGEIWAGNNDVLLYVDAGRDVHATVSLDSTASGARIEVGFDGYLIDL